MGKTGAFLTTDRILAPERPLDQQVADFQEFHETFDEEDLQAQASRCMDCGVPFCHVAQKFGGASVGCPLGNLIPEVNDLAYQGRYQEAYDRLRMTNPFPEFTGRVCPAICEGSCVLGEHRPPVNIKAIEFFLSELATKASFPNSRSSFPNSRSSFPRSRSSFPRMRESTADDSESSNVSSTAQGNVAPAKVAVIGSGPAGLAAADYLNRAGVQVTVFEQAHRAGGLLTYGIPSMKLDKATVQATIDRLSAAGIIFKLDYEVTKGRSQELLEGFDALMVCGGARKPRMPKINPEGLSGLYPAMDYLVYTTRRQLGETPENPLLEGAGKHVVVVGNGDTATDCVATAVRQQAASITQLYYRVKPSEQRSASQPWPLYPKLFKTEYGQAEAAYVYGQDPREFAVNPTGVRGQDGRIDTLVIQDTQWQMVDGKNTMSYVEGTERQIPADLILIATGFAGPEDTLCEAFTLERDRRSNVAGQDGSHQTNVENIFTAGDMHTGQSLVVSAIKDGLEAAKECYNYICALK